MRKFGSLREICRLLDENKPPVVLPSQEREAQEATLLPSAGQEIPNTDIPGPSIQESPTTHTAISTSSMEEHPPLPTFSSLQEETQQNPKRAKTDIAGPSDPSSPPTSTIPTVQSNILHFKLKAGTLSKAIAPLVDPEFNPEGLGKIEMSTFGFFINVCNAERNVMGRLWLEKSALSEFSYSPDRPYLQYPMIGKKSNIGQIFENLKAVNDEDIVAVYYHNMCTTQLFFNIGSEPSSRFSVELLEPDNEVDMFPEYWLVDKYWVGLVTNPEVEQMISDLSPFHLKEKPPLVSVAVDFRKRTASMTVERRHLQDHENIKHNARTHKFARFHWFYEKLLSSATTLEYEFYIRIIGEPLNCIKMEFDYAGDLGTLILITKANIVDYGNYQLNAN